ncbi:hypothetical protein KC338_g27 [Hortaea werneckii]|nr:hypothetical protein KC338_g27 [Hortaea werneckii]
MTTVFPSREKRFLVGPIASVSSLSGAFSVVLKSQRGSWAAEHGLRAALREEGLKSAGAVERSKEAIAMLNLNGKTKDEDKSCKTLLKKTRPGRATRVSNAFDSGTLQLTDGTMMTSSDASEVSKRTGDVDGAGGDGAGKVLTESSEVKHCNIGMTKGAKRDRDSRRETASLSGVGNSRHCCWRESPIEPCNSPSPSGRRRCRSPAAQA